MPKVISRFYEHICRVRSVIAVVHAHDDPKDNMHPKDNLHMFEWSSDVSPPRGS